MRLWHRDLLPVLPRQQLLSQWRECCGIVKDIVKYGNPHHILVNRIMDYPVFHFEYYVQEVLKEMHERGYQISDKAYQKYSERLSKIREKFTKVQTAYDGFVLFSDWHNDIYLRQCLYNLEEKYICGGIPDDEWDRICCKFTNYNLYNKKPH